MFSYVNPKLITENVTGLEEIRYIPEADDPKNIGIENDEDKFAIYYFIDSKTLFDNTILLMSSH